MFAASERRWAGKSRLLRQVADLEESGRCQHTVYLRPESMESCQPEHTVLSSHALDGAVGPVIEQVGDSETGLVVFVGCQEATAVVPPFPVGADLLAEGAETSPLVELLNQNLLVGVVLLRLGRYAVGVLRGDTLLASKTASRYVKNRHRAGGSSQRRFERSRERLVRELYDKTCQVVRDVFSPYENEVDYILMGGEQHTLSGFRRRCRYLKDFDHRILTRVLQVDRPGQDALNRIAYEVWKSRVITFSYERFQV